MRIGIVSDIHSNRHALDAMREDFSNRNVDSFWCTGDFVNYGGDPAYIMEWSLEAVDYAVLGNHDAVICHRESPKYFNKYAIETIPFTRAQLSDAQSDWLSNLPFEREVQGVKLVHASPYNPDEWVYIMSKNQAQSQFKFFSEQICFYGHTHVQVGYDTKGNTYYEGTIKIEANTRYLINPGSIGQPRDRDSRWGAAIYDTQDKTIELIRGNYDIDSAIKEIFQNDLPRYLGHRLHEGK